MSNGPWVMGLARCTLNLNPCPGRSPPVTHHSTAAFALSIQNVSTIVSAARRATGGQIPEQVRGPSSAPRRAPITRFRNGGFTLIELLTALLILSLLALMSYRGLGAVLDARTHVRQETDKWRHVAAFCARFEQDVEMAAPRPVRSASGSAPAWIGRPDTITGPLLEFSRFASAEGMDTPRRVAYGLNDKHEIELWLWAGLDVAPSALPVRYPVLRGVTKFEFQYLGADLAWKDAWPLSPLDTALPRAVRLRIVLDSGEEIVRVFSLNS